MSCDFKMQTISVTLKNFMSYTEAELPEKFHTTFGTAMHTKSLSEADYV